MSLFTPTDAVVLTSTTSSQTVTVPAGCTSMAVSNLAANPVYLRFAASVAVPGSTFSGNQTMCVPSGITRGYCIPNGGGTLAYIASTAGGSLIIAVGNGD